MRVMRADASAQESGARRYALLAWEEERRDFEMATPISAERTWPRIVFRGWASGEERMLNSRIAAAPLTTTLLALIPTLCRGEGGGLPSCL